MRYLSVFSGIGGLEHSVHRPVLMCDADPACRRVLAKCYPNTEIWDDITTLRSQQVDAVCGGWPCQDLTVAGRMSGIRGERSGLFFTMVRLAVECGAHTIVGENVPNILRLRKGADFGIVVQTLQDAGFPWISWRTLDAREFGLPQTRKRVFIVASKQKETACSLHRPIRYEHERKKHSNLSKQGSTGAPWASFGFYWTGGLGRSLCLTDRAIPALKVGSSTSKGTSPVAVYIDGVPRRLSGKDCLALQGFEDYRPFHSEIEGDLYRMAGNAVPRTMGHFAVGSLTEDSSAVVIQKTNTVQPAGLVGDGAIWSVKHEAVFVDHDLRSFLSSDYRTLSPQASAGLLSRVIRAERRIPVCLFDALYKLSRTRTRLIGTRINSFIVLDEELDASAYREWLVAGGAFSGS